MAELDPLVDRGTRLFQFLARAQQLRSATVQSTDRYERDGAVHWFHKIPQHPAVRLGGRETDVESGDETFLLSVDRVGKEAWPSVPDELSGWLHGDIDRPDGNPRLKTDRVTGEVWDADAGRMIDRVERSIDQPELLVGFDRWHHAWRAWSASEAQNRPVRELYEKLFRSHMTGTQRAEEMEFVLGAALLAWRPQSLAAMSRHVFTVPVVGEIDDQTGRLTSASTRRRSDSPSSSTWWILRSCPRAPWCRLSLGPPKSSPARRSTSPPSVRRPAPSSTSCRRPGAMSRASTRPRLPKTRSSHGRRRSSCAHDPVPAWSRSSRASLTPLPPRVRYPRG